MPRDTLTGKSSSERSSPVGRTWQLERSVYSPWKLQLHVSAPPLTDQPRKAQPHSELFIECCWDVPFTEKVELNGDLCVFHFCRWSTWPEMPKTIWCLFFTLIAWTWPSRSLATGTATSTDSWRERVCMKYIWVVSIGTEMRRFLSMGFHILFHWFSGVWILVWPCDQLVEEETDLLKHPLHVLRRHDRGISVHSVGSFYSGYLFFYSSPLAGYNNMWLLCFQDTGREIDKLCSFLGLSPSAEEKKQITGGVQFDTMKKNDMVNHCTIPIMDFKISPFMRKGKLINKSAECVCVSWDKIRSPPAKMTLDSLWFCREGRWLEEPFHCGPEWRVWGRLQEKDEGPHTWVPHWSLNGTEQGCMWRLVHNWLDDSVFFLYAVQMQHYM